MIQMIVARNTNEAECSVFGLRSELADEEKYKCLLMVFPDGYIGVRKLNPLVYS